MIRRVIPQGRSWPAGARTGADQGRAMIASCSSEATDRQSDLDQPQTRRRSPARRCGAGNYRRRRRDAATAAGREAVVADHRARWITGRAQVGTPTDSQRRPHRGWTTPRGESRGRDHPPPCRAPRSPAEPPRRQRSSVANAGSSPFSTPPGVARGSTSSPTVLHATRCVDSGVQVPLPVEGRASSEPRPHSWRPGRAPRGQIGCVVGLSLHAGDDAAGNPGPRAGGCGCGCRRDRRLRAPPSRSRQRQHAIRRRPGRDAGLSASHELRAARASTSSTSG